MRIQNSGLRDVLIFRSCSIHLYKSLLTRKIIGNGMEWIAHRSNSKVWSSIDRSYGYVGSRFFSALPRILPSMHVERLLTLINAKVMLTSRVHTWLPRENRVGVARYKLFRLKLLFSLYSALLPLLSPIAPVIFI